MCWTRLQVDQGDLHRVAAATGAQIQTTVNNLDAKVLGSCADFEEKQVTRSGPTLCVSSVTLPAAMHGSQSLLHSGMVLQPSPSLLVFSSQEWQPGTALACWGAAKPRQTLC